MTTTANGVAYGRPAMELLARQVTAIKGGDPLAPVTVVVPYNSVAVAARRALAAQPKGIANVSFLTLHRLAERLGAGRLAAANRLPTSAPVIAAAVRGVLAESPGVFAPVAGHPSTERALVTAHLELSSAADGALDPVAACSPRAADVVRIHRAVRDLLASDWYDEHDLLVAAAETLTEQPVTAATGPLIVHLLQDIPSAAATVLALLEPVHVNIGLTGDADADTPVLAAHKRAGVVPSQNPTTIEPAHAAAIVSASDPDDEVRAAVRLVTTWMHEGVNLGRIALVYGMRNPYARLLHEQLTAAGIPWNGTPVREIGDLLIGRTLKAMLSLGDRGYRRSDVLGVLTGAPLLDGERRVPGRAWERVSRVAGVVAGDDWDERLGHLAARHRQEAESLEAEREDDWRAKAKRSDADRADALATFVRRLRSDIDAGTNADSWAAMVAWAKLLVTTYLGDDRHRFGWPDEEREAAHRVDAALDRLAGLDALKGPPPTVDVFRRALDSELEVGVKRVGRLGEGVLVGAASTAAGLVLDRIVVLGMAEGVFPPRRLEDSLLPDAERATAEGELQLRAHRVHDDRRHLLAAMASADHAVLCQPRGDLRRAGERPASRWLVSDAARLANNSSLCSDELAHHSSEDWLDFVQSFAAGLKHMAHPASDQDLRLSAVARNTYDHTALSADAILSNAREVTEARRSATFTRFDGNLAAVANEVGRPPTASASRLQTYAKCPHQYLLHCVLGVEPIEEPAGLLEISNLDRGSLIHEILDEFIGGAIADGHELDQWSANDQAALKKVAAKHFASYEASGRTGRNLFWRRDKKQIENDLRRFLEHDSARLAEGYRPLSTEEQFASIPLDLPGGHRLLVRGMIDRVDRAPNGSLEVLDYKTGSSKAYRNLSADTPHVGGTMLQLYIYAVAAQANFNTTDPVHSAYWFNTEKGGFQIKGYTVTPEVATEVAKAVDAIVEGIAAGVFPARPAEPSSRTFHVDCWYCTPDGLSTTDRRREWEHKRLDRALARYVGLAEPEVHVDDA